VGDGKAAILKSSEQSGETAMHEFSTAVSIVQAVTDAATTHGATRVAAIHLQVGQMSMLNHDQLLFGIEIAAQETVAQNAKVTIEVLPIKIACKSCGTESIPEGEQSIYEILSSMTCPKCGSREVDVIQGRECIVKDIEAVVDD
jgi:hydrogenase nickel incorporation protein HypA/HybF